MDTILSFTAPAQSATLATFVAETLMIQRYFGTTLELQLDEPNLQSDPAASQLIADLHDVVSEQCRQLTQALGTGTAMKSLLAHASSELSGMFLGFICKCRARHPRAILRADYAILNAIELNYRIMLNAARANGEPSVVGLATNHLECLRALTAEVRRQLSIPVEKPVRKAARRA